MFKTTKQLSYLAKFLSVVSFAYVVAFTNPNPITAEYRCIRYKHNGVDIVNVYKVETYHGMIIPHFIRRNIGVKNQGGIEERCRFIDLVDEDIKIK